MIQIGKNTKESPVSKTKKIPENIVQKWATVCWLCRSEKIKKPKHIKEWDGEGVGGFREQSISWTRPHPSLHSRGAMTEAFKDEGSEVKHRLCQGPQSVTAITGRKKKPYFASPTWEAQCESDAINTEKVIRRYSLSLFNGRVKDSNTELLQLFFWKSSQKGKIWIQDKKLSNN